MVDYKFSLTKAAETLFPKIIDELSSQILKKYSQEKWDFSQLDKWRSVDFPKVLAKRHAKGDLNIKKDELALLMDWKLAKGKFRPALPKLIRDNTENTVENVTREGFEAFIKYALTISSWNDIDVSHYCAALRSSLKKLTELRGVGSATASLLLSLLAEVTPLAPAFFSDEAFMYFVQEPLHPGQSIKYNIKEYVDEYIPLLISVARKFQITSLNELERGAWALKLYDLHHINKYAAVELPSDIDIGATEKFAIASEFAVDASKTSTKKRKTSTKSEAANKKVKKET